MDRAELRAWLVEEWSRRLADVIESMTEVRPEPVAAILPTPAEAGDGSVWYFMALDAGQDAGLLLGVSPEDWFALGRNALEAAGLTDVSREDAEGTAIEIAGQATGGISQTLTTRLEREILSLPPKLTEDLPADSVATEIALTLDGHVVRLRLAVNEGLLDALAQRVESPAPDTVQQAQDVAGPAPGRPLPNSKTLDLLMEVELPVSVSFGRAQLPLRDVLKLNSGSIVELNRSVSEPVEIIVNNCVIARGEVVVVDGNYGVRIQQVISREERLRTLH